MLKKIIRFAWKIQPRALRRLELDIVEKYLTRPLSLPRSYKKGGIIVCGLLGTASGLGQGARHMQHFFEAENLPVYCANMSRFAVLEDFEAGPLWPDNAPEGGAVVFHINPDIFGLIWNAIGRRRLQNRRLIGYWAWELETPPERWRYSVKLVDEIWTPSHFVADAVRKIADGKPVHVVPHIFDVEHIRTIPKQDPLPALKGKKIVFFAYDVRSLHARKNPEAIIEAFRRTAGNDPDSVLIIKINNNHAWPEAGHRVEQAAKGLNNVIIMHDKFSDDQMQDLIARVDIVMSLHRSEGFGMLMASAMAAAKPVIATGWSANLDFMTPECSVLIDSKLIPIVDPQHVYDKFDARWADPDVGQAAAALQKLLNDPAERQRMGQAARRHVLAFFARENWMRSLPDSFWQSIELKTTEKA